MNRITCVSCCLCSFVLIVSSFMQSTEFMETIAASGIWLVAGGVWYIAGLLQEKHSK